MGLHRDADEADFSWPVLSISLGDPGLFRVGGASRKDPTQSVLLESGDVVVFGGPARLAYHGIDRIRFGARAIAAGGRTDQPDAAGGRLASARSGAGGCTGRRVKPSLNLASSD